MNYRLMKFAFTMSIPIFNFLLVVHILLIRVLKFPLLTPYFHDYVYLIANEQAVNDLFKEKLNAVIMAIVVKVRFIIMV